jgi:GT2 family glycosyltransferase
VGYEGIEKSSLENGFYYAVQARNFFGLNEPFVLYLRKITFIILFYLSFILSFVHQILKRFTKKLETKFKKNIIKKM